MIEIKKIIKRIVLVILILLWMYIVFGFSGQNGEISGGLSLKLVKIFIQDKKVIEIVHPIVRKLAHFSLYTLGGFLIFSFIETFKLRKRTVFVITLILGILYAISDEFHQMFIAGRSAQIADVLIDSGGIIFGSIVCIVYSKLSTKAKGNILVILLMFLIFGWMVAVFMFSNQDGNTSENLSLKITKLITQDPKKIKIIHPIVRKMAHFTIYTVGGMLIYFLVNSCKMKTIFKIILTLFLGILYAGTDEIHQYFISKRTAKIADVWIDSLGVVLGMILAIAICSLIKFIIKKRGEKKISD